ncbi:MAG: helix-turn-helix domain-containing protein [Geminicoccaceae bacterium]
MNDAKMGPKTFKIWRKQLGLSQKQTAEALGLKNRIVQYYEKGERDGKKVDIPKTVRLACFALQHGVGDYDGETPTPFLLEDKKERKKRIKKEKED